MKLGTRYLQLFALWLVGLSGTTLVGQSPLTVQFIEKDLHAIWRGGDVIVGAGAAGNLVRSTDGGGEFSIAFEGDPMDSLFALAEANGTMIATGRTGVMFRSVDQGESWTEVSDVTLGDLVGVAGNGDGRWVATGIGDFEPAILVSKDDGKTWTEIDAEEDEVAAAELYGVVWHAQSERFVAVGGDGFQEGRILASATGTEWETIEHIPSAAGQLRFIEADGAGGLLAGGEGGTLIYSEGEELVFEVVSGTSVSETLTSAVSLPDAGHWAVGGAARLLLEIRGEAGVVVVSEAAPPASQVEGLVFLEPDTLLAAGMFSGEAGEAPVEPTFEITSSPEDQAVFEEDDAVFLGGVNGANLTIEWERSTDGGENWSLIPGANAISFTEPNVTLAMDGNLYRMVVSDSTTTEPERTEVAALAVEALVAPGESRFAKKVTGFEAFGYLFLPDGQFRRVNAAGEWVDGEWFYLRSDSDSDRATVAFFDEDGIPDPVVRNVFLEFDESGEAGYSLTEGGPEVGRVDFVFDFFGLERTSGESSRQSIWLGTFDDRHFDHEDNEGWIDHKEHGWLYVAGVRAPGGMWLWDHIQQDWLWTRQSLYPFFYSDGRQAWAYYDRGGTKKARKFYFYDDDLSEWAAEAVP